MVSLIAVFHVGSLLHKLLHCIKVYYGHMVLFSFDRVFLVVLLNQECIRTGD